MIKQFIKIIIPQRVRNKVRAYFREDNQKEREEIEKQIPKIPLTEKNICNCQVLLNREILLSKLKKGGNVAEIGVDQGEFSELILKITEPNMLHLIDIWDSGRYPGSLFEKVNNNFKELIDDGCIQIHKKLSTDAAKDFPENYFDWIYIDTDHSYEVTRNELQIYASKIKSNGIIAGHDYCKGNWVYGYRFGVIEAVHEFCVNEGWEFIYVTLEPIENQSFAIKRIQRTESDESSIEHSL